MGMSLLHNVRALCLAGLEGNIDIFHGSSCSGLSFHDIGHSSLAVLGAEIVLGTWQGNS